MDQSDNDAIAYFVGKKGVYSYPPEVALRLKGSDAGFYDHMAWCECKMLDTLLVCRLRPAIKELENGSWELATVEPFAGIVEYTAHFIRGASRYGVLKKRVLQLAREFIAEEEAKRAKR